MGGTDPEISTAKQKLQPHYLPETAEALQASGSQECNYARQENSVELRAQISSQGISSTSPLMAMSNYFMTTVTYCEASEYKSLKYFKCSKLYI